MKIGVKNSRVKGLKKIMSIKKSKFGAFSALSLSFDQKKPFDLQTNELKRKKNFIEAFFFFLRLATVTTLTLKICIGNSTL